MGIAMQTLTRNSEASTIELENALSGPRIWAIAGGTAGVGSSVVTSSLAVALAQRGARCAVVDAELGGVTLQTLLGARSPRRTVTDTEPDPSVGSRSRRAKARCCVPASGPSPLTQRALLRWRARLP